MIFDDNKPIYLQIVDDISRKILSGSIGPGDRIQSVREWGAAIGVNPNTVARSYEVLTSKGIIYNQRGIGFFVSTGAVDIIREAERKIFIETEFPKVRERAALLDIDLKTLI